MKYPKSFIFVFSILLCLSAGFLGSFFTVTSINSWYSTINKPFFNPSNWVFGPVWTILYILMGIFLFLILIYNAKSKNNSKIKKLALTFFFIQLILNTLWSILFFGLKNPLIAFIEIIFLWIFILLTIIYSYKISKPASFLLIPYILWVSFASVLNLFIVILN